MVSVSFVRIQIQHNLCSSQSQIFDVALPFGKVRVTFAFLQTINGLLVRIMSVEESFEKPKLFVGTSLDQSCVIIPKQIGQINDPGQAGNHQKMEWDVTEIHEQISLT